MSVDLRGFDYPLEPLRVRQQWQLDAQRVRLGTVLRELAETQQRLEDLRSQHGARSRELSDQLTRRWDAAHHSGSLRWLARLRSSLQQLELEVAELQVLKSELGAQCLACQRRLDALDAHRDEMQSEFAREETGRAASEADREWLTHMEMSRP
jgi:predicted  nucleic acid-binding Zn-ribbon protein